MLQTQKQPPSLLLLSKLEVGCYGLNGELGVENSGFAMVVMSIGMDALGMKKFLDMPPENLQDGKCGLV